MCAAYNEKNKLWGHLDEKSLGDSRIQLGRIILDLLSSHGNKVAQVLNQMRVFDLNPFIPKNMFADQ